MTPSHSGDHQGIARRAVREIESLDVRIMEAKAEAADRSGITADSPLTPNHCFLLHKHSLFAFRHAHLGREIAVMHGGRIHPGASGPLIETCLDTFFPAEILFFRGTCHPNARHDNEQRESKSVFSHFFLLPCRHATYDRSFSQSTDVRFLDEVGGQLTAHVTARPSRQQFRRARLRKQVTGVTRHDQSPISSPDISRNDLFGLKAHLRIQRDTLQIANHETDERLRINLLAIIVERGGS